MSKSSRGTDSDSVFNVVVAYEDVATSKRALQTCEFIARQLGSDVHVSKSMWKFDVLDMPGMKELAASDVDEADMIILSAHTRVLPPVVQRWIERSSNSGPEHPKALVALLDDEGEPTTDELGVAYLEKLAADRQMDFFTRSDRASA